MTNLMVFPANKSIIKQQANKLSVKQQFMIGKRRRVATSVRILPKEKAEQIMVDERRKTMLCLQSVMEKIEEEIKLTEKKQRETNKYYYTWVKNPLEGQHRLWGKEGVLSMVKDLIENPKNIVPVPHIKELYFEDIQFRSKLRKLRDKLSLLEQQRNIFLTKIKILEKLPKVIHLFLTSARVLKWCMEELGLSKRKIALNGIFDSKNK